MARSILFDFIIEKNGILYPIVIKKNTSETAYVTSAFQLLDKVERTPMRS